VSRLAARASQYKAPHLLAGGRVPRVQELQRDIVAEAEQGRGVGASQGARLLEEIESASFPVSLGPA